MTYYDTQHNTIRSSIRSNGAFNSQAGQPFGAWPGAPSMQAIGVTELGRQPMVSNTVNMAVSRPSALLGTTPMGCAASGLGQQQQPPWGGQQQRQLSQQESARSYGTGASPASDPGPGTATAWAGLIRRLRPGPAPAEPARCQRGGADNFADRATDRRNAAGAPQLQYAACRAARASVRLGKAPLQNSERNLERRNSSRRSALRRLGPTAETTHQQDVADITRQLIGVIPR